MVTLKEAYDLVHSKYPDMRVLGCLDYGTFYGFKTISRTWNGEAGRLEQMPSNTSLTYIRKKNGSIFFLSFSEVLALDSKTPPTEVDILNYLSPTDTDFARKVRNHPR